MEELPDLTCKEVASVLIRISQNKAAENAFEDVLKESSEKERQMIFSELYYLRIFAVDFSAYIAIGSTSYKNDIMDIYYNELQAVPDFYENVKYRLARYTIAVRTEHENGLSFMVGKVFSELCGYESDAVLTYLGSLEFHSTFEQVSELFKSIRIKAE